MEGLYIYQLFSYHWIINRTINVEIPRMRQTQKTTTEKSDEDSEHLKKRKIENCDPSTEVDVEVTVNNSKWIPPIDLSQRNISVARAISEMKGHTAFLTFAVRPSIFEE